jgi:hypothetical protein
VFESRPEGGAVSMTTVVAEVTGRADGARWQEEPLSYQTLLRTVAVGLPIELVAQSLGQWRRNSDELF